MRTISMLLLGILALVSGCKAYATVQPLVDPDKPVSDDRLIGRWYSQTDSKDPKTGEAIKVIDESRYIVVTKKGNNTYDVSSVGSTKDQFGQFDVVPFLVGHRKFLQVRRTYLDPNFRDRQLLDMHYFMAYRIDDDKFYLTVADDDKLKRLAEAGGVPMKTARDGTYLFTGDRQQILDLLKKNLDDVFPASKEHKYPLHHRPVSEEDMAGDS